MGLGLVDVTVPFVTILEITCVGSKYLFWLRTDLRCLSTFSDCHIVRFAEYFGYYSNLRDAGLLLTTLLENFKSFEECLSTIWL